VHTRRRSGESRDSGSSADAPPPPPARAVPPRSLPRRLQEERREWRAADLAQRNFINARVLWTRYLQARRAGLRHGGWEKKGRWSVRTRRRPSPSAGRRRRRCRIPPTTR